MRKSRKKGDNLVHYAVHKKDRQAWGAPTLCGKRKVTMSFDHTKVTCTKCMVYTNRGPRKRNQACENPMILCGYCDRGELLFVVRNKTHYVLACTNCDHQEKRSYGSLTI